MPYDYKGQPKEAIEPQDELPRHLQHKPIYALPYEHFDGPYIGDTDARYLSVGLAQWNPGEVALKVFRHTGSTGGKPGKWTRQSEELPPQRVIDATTLLAKVLFDQDPGTKSVVLPAGTLEGQIADITIEREDEPMAGNFDRYLKDEENKQRYQERFRALYDVLHRLAEQGKL